MGHIVNAISTRLGWFETWKDDIYLDFKHQCDYVHHFIRIRFLLVFTFFAKVPWDEYMMVFSHFEFYKKKRLIYATIFVYLGKVLMFSADLEIYHKRNLKAGVRWFRYRGPNRRPYSIYRLILLGMTLGFKEIPELYTQKGRKRYKSRYGKYYYSYKLKPFYNYVKLNDFAKRRLYSLEAFRVINTFYKANRGITKNKVGKLRRLAYLGYFEKAMAKWDNVQLLFEAFFLNYLYKPFYSWMSLFIEYWISNLFISDKSFVTFQYFDMIV